MLFRMPLRAAGAFGGLVAAGSLLLSSLVPVAQAGSVVPGARSIDHSGVAAAPSPNSLWLANDAVGNTFRTDTAGNVLIDLGVLDTAGAAYDGTTLYLGTHQGVISRRNPTTGAELSSFTVPTRGGPTEDLAWDSARGKLWRVDHNPPTLLRINATTGLEEAFVLLPATDTTLGAMGALGLAYNRSIDRLYVSMCSAGCLNYLNGLVLVVNPATGAVEAELFRTSGGADAAVGGLAYDPATNTLWAGSDFEVRNYSLTGTILSSFSRPAPGGYVDGLEFIAGPTCTVTQNHALVSGTLNLEWTLKANVPTTWNAWLVIGSSVTPILSVPLPALDPAFTLGPIPIPSFPPLGTIGFLTTMNTPEGILCWDFDLVDTGTTSPAGKRLKGDELQAILPEIRAAILLP